MFNSFFNRLDSRKAMVFVLFISLILIVIIFFQKREMQQQMELKVQFIEQKNILRDELDDIIEEHDYLLDEYGELNNQLHEKDSLIQNQISEIRRLIRIESDLKSARKKIEVLKSISRKYVANIDSLLILNKELINEKDSVINVNKDINWKNYKLNQQNKKLEEQVNKGSVLKINMIEIEAIKYKSTGKEVVTKQAKKTQKIRVCFTIAANPIAVSEIKKAYIQIIDNDGMILVGVDSLSTIIADTVVSCTEVSDFDYKNIEMVHCLEWERINILASGYYLVNIIIEEKILGNIRLKLK